MTNESLHTQLATVAAQVYPGMFEDEVQATVKLDNREVTVITSKSHVELPESTVPSETGTSGRLKVYLVEASDKGYLIDLPGEALGTTKRILVSKGQIRKV